MRSVSANLYIPFRPCTRAPFSTSKLIEHEDGQADSKEQDAEIQQHDRRLPDIQLAQSRTADVGRLFFSPSCTEVLLAFPEQSADPCRSVSVAAEAVQSHALLRGKTYGSQIQDEAPVP